MVVIEEGRNDHAVEIKKEERRRDRCNRVAMIKS